MYIDDLYDKSIKKMKNIAKLKKDGFTYSFPCI